MRLRLFIISVVILLSVPILLFSQPIQESDSLAEATDLRPIDLVSNMSGWNIASADMYTFWINNGLYGNYGPQPKIMLNGLPVDANFWGWQSLNMLPIYLPDLDRVIFSDNEIYSDLSHPGGFIDFSGAMPDSGWSAKASLFLGNETGDPGPWVYDSTRVTPNVDRWGPDAGGVLSFSRNKWYGKGIFMLRRHQQTDPISHRRIHTTMRELGGTRFYPIQTNSQSSMLETGYRSDTWKVRARGILAEDRNYIFLQPFGREVPAQVEYRQLAIETDYDISSWNFNLRYILDQKKLNKRNSEHDYVFDWDELDNSYIGSAVYTAQNIQLKGRINIDIKKVKAPGLLQQNYTIPGFYLSAGLVNDEDSGYRISSGIEVQGKNTAKTFKAVYSQKLQPRWTIELSASYIEVLPIRQESFGYWISQGYNFHEQLGILVDEPLTISNNRLLNFEAAGSYELSDSFSFSLSSGINHHLEQNIPWQNVSYDANTGSSPGLFVISQEKGTRISSESKLAHEPAAWLNHSLSLQVQSSLKGSRRFKDYYRQIPATQIKYRVSINPIEDLALSLQGIYRSSTRWKEFDALDGEVYRDIDNLFPVFTGTYDSTVPAHLNIAAGAKKSFWQERVSLQFTVQNLLNDEIRLHPMGADKSLMFNIKAVAGF